MSTHGLRPAFSWKAISLKTLLAQTMSEMEKLQQMMSSGALCAILNCRWIMKLPTLWLLYLPVLIVYAGLVTLWSDWPEKLGGWLLAIKRKLPPALQPLHPKYVLVWLATACVLGLCLELLD